MAKLTGQFTTPRFDANNNKTHEAFLHAVVFVFTSDTTKVAKETGAKGKYSFDLANGEYEVSVYLKGNTEKDRFDMRAGEKFVVTATTRADALEKWLQVIGDNGKDELATYYENLLAQMQRLYEDTKAMRDEIVSGSVGDGRWIKEGWCGLAGSLTRLAVGEGNLGQASGFYLGNTDTVISGRFFIDFRNNDKNQAFRISNDIYSDRFYLNSWNLGGMYNPKLEIIHTGNTTIDSNGNIKSASPIIKLFNDHIESNDSFKEKPNFEKLGTGVYKITNTLGLSKNGWTHNIPLNSNGRGYFRVRVEHLEDGCIVRVFKIKNVLNPDTFEIDVVDGDPIDIGKDQRWIDLRFHEEQQETDDEELLTQLDNLDESAH